jgi:hypothetical protein
MDLYFNLRRWPFDWADMHVYGVTSHGAALLEEHLGSLKEQRLQWAAS